MTAGARRIGPEKYRSHKCELRCDGRSAETRNYKNKLAGQHKNKPLHYKLIYNYGSIVVVTNPLYKLVGNIYG